MTRGRGTKFCHSSNCRGVNWVNCSPNFLNARKNWPCFQLNARVQIVAALLTPGVWIKLSFLNPPPQKKVLSLSINTAVLACSFTIRCSLLTVSHEASPLLTLSVPASLSICKFSLHYPHKISCLVMRIK